MIERHYFRERLLKTFDFDFGFCIPSSRNTCEHIYEFPQLSEEEKEEAGMGLGWEYYELDFCQPSGYGCLVFGHTDLKQH